MRFRPYNDLLREATTYHQAAVEMAARKDNRCNGYFQKADALYKDLLNTTPDSAQILFMRGTLDLQIRESGRAIALLEKATRLEPGMMDAFNNLGAAWRQEHQNDKAREAYLKALELKPDEADVLANLCALAVNEGNPESGIEYGNRCLAINPKHPQGRWNMALLKLENEEYEEGFRLYNDGFETGDRIMRTYIDKRGMDVPLWDGRTPEEGATIVVWGEQGQGDELLWLQFVPELRQHFSRIIIDCHPKLRAAVQRSFPWATVYPTRKESPEWSVSEEIHYKQSIASLPQWFHMKRRANVPYLKPDPTKVTTVTEMIRYWQRKTGRVGQPVVGIHWMGGRHKTRADMRSVFLDKWGPIMDMPITLVSHQYTEQAPEDVSPYADRILHWQGITSAKDYDWNLALIGACDLLISVNTSAVHAAGAMGAPCWTLTPYGRAWRYGKATDRITFNPFYKTVQQFNQREGEGWEIVMQEVADELKQFIGKAA